MRDSKRVFIIFFISFILQAALISLWRIPIDGDARCYNEVAKNLIEKGYFTDDGISPSAGFIKPGYCLFLAAIYILCGQNIFVVKIAQAILIALSCVLNYKIGNRLFNEQVGYMSGLIMVFHPAFIIISSHLITESLFTFLFLLSIFYLILAIEKDSMRLYLLSSFILGISTHVRFTTFFFPLFIAGGLLFLYSEKKLAIKTILGIILVFIIVIIPWNIRNYICFGYVNPVVEYGGIFWVGTYTKGKANQNDPNLRAARYKIYEGLRPYYRPEEMDSGKFLTEYEKVMFRSSFENIIQDPLAYAGLFPIKILRLWVSSYSGLFLIKAHFSDFLRNNQLMKEQLFILVWKSWVFLFSLSLFCIGTIGMVLRFRMWKKLAPLYLVIIYFTLLHMVALANSRLGIPALPYMAIFASSAICGFLTGIEV